MADETATAEPAAEAPKEAKAKAPKEAKAKKPDAKTKSKAKAKGKGKAAKGETLPSVANHPRAGAQIARAKAWGGLGGFLAAGVLSWRAGVPAADLLLRALMLGVAGYVGAWACAVIVWRHLVIAELRAVRSYQAARAARAAQAAAATAEQSR